MSKLIPVTRDQEYMAKMLVELKEIHQLLAALQDGEGKVKCPVCGRSFQNDRALRAHMRVHRGG